MCIRDRDQIEPRLEALLPFRLEIIRLVDGLPPVEVGIFRKRLDALQPLDLGVDQVAEELDALLLAGELSDLAKNLAIGFVVPVERLDQIALHLHAAQTYR